MKVFDWDDQKNALLKRTRGVSFEQIVLAIGTGDLIDRVRPPNPDRYPNQKVFIHIVINADRETPPNPDRYPNQKVFLVKIEDDIYSVPYVEADDVIFLKTIIPSRKATKAYLRGRK